MSFIKMAREFLQAVAGELDPYTSDKSVIKIDSFKELSMQTVAHVQYAKYGRGPGKMPPISGLIDWVKKKGIVKGDKEARGTAFAIAKSISKNGTKNWKPNAPNAIEEAINKHATDYLKDLSNFLLETQVQELDELYREKLGRTITIKL